MLYTHKHKQIDLKLIYSLQRWNRLQAWIGLSIVHIRTKAILIHFLARKFASVPPQTEAQPFDRRGESFGHCGPGLPGHGLPRETQLHPPGPGRSKLPRWDGERGQGDNRIPKTC